MNKEVPKRIENYQNYTRSDRQISKTMTIEEIFDVERRELIKNLNVWAIENHYELEKEKPTEVICKIIDLIQFGKV